MYSSTTSLRILSTSELLLRTGLKGGVPKAFRLALLPLGPTEKLSALTVLPPSDEKELPRERAVGEPEVDGDCGGDRENGTGWACWGGAACGGGVPKALRLALLPPAPTGKLSALVVLPVLLLLPTDEAELAEEAEEVRERDGAEPEGGGVRRPEVGGWACAACGGGGACGGAATGGAGGRGPVEGGLGGAKVIGEEDGGLFEAGRFLTGGGIVMGGGFCAAGRPTWFMALVASGPKDGPKSGEGMLGGADAILDGTGGGGGWAWGWALALGFKNFGIENNGARRPKSAVPEADCSGGNCINNKICQD